MFDIGLSEIIVIIIVSFFMLDMKDMVKIIKFVKGFFSQVNTIISEFKSIIDNLEKSELTQKKIIDLDGNEQIAYDLEETFTDVKKTKNKHS